MFREGEPVPQEAIPEKKKGINKKKILAILGVFLSTTVPSAKPSEGAGLKDSLKEMAVAAVLKEGQRRLEKTEHRKLRERTLEATRKGNEKFRFKFPKNPRFLVEPVVFEGRGRWGWGSSSEYNQISRLTLQRTLENTFEGCSVVPLDKVRDETAERQELRENEEVDKETIPPKGTIKREDVEVGPRILLFSDAKSLQSYMGGDSRGWWGRGTEVNFEKLKILALGEIAFRNPATQEESTFHLIGGSSAYTEINLDTPGLRLDRRKMDDATAQLVQAIQMAIDNMAQILEEQKKGKTYLGTTKKGTNLFIPPEAPWQKEQKEKEAEKPKEEFVAPEESKD